MDKIYLKGIKIYAYHGCLKQENIIGSNYKITLMVKTNLKTCPLHIQALI